MAFVQRSLQFKFQLGTGSFGDSGGASTKIVSNVRASVRIEKKGAPGMNSASMRISGLTASTMNQLSRIGVMPNPNDATSFRDPIAHACYPAQIKFLQSLPQIQAIKAPAPYNVIVLFQRKRDLVAQIKAGLPGYLKVGCAALLKDEERILVQTLGLIGVSVGAGVLTGVFPAAAPITLPALTI